MVPAMLVSCIMPTRDRRRFVQRAVRQWEHQDYPERELVVIDSGMDPVADVLPRHPRVHYLRARPGLPLGTARNLACSAAQGPVIAHWDDDDWMGSNRLSTQIRALCSSNAQVCGLGTMTYVDIRGGNAWRYAPTRHDPLWLAGGTLAYRRTTWQRNCFRPVSVGEDGAFVAGIRTSGLLPMPDEGWYVAVLHGANTSSRHANDGRWTPIAPQEVVRRTRYSWPHLAARHLAMCAPVETA